MIEKSKGDLKMTNYIDSQRIKMPWYSDRYRTVTTYDHNGNNIADTARAYNYSSRATIDYWDVNEDGWVDTMYNHQTKQKYDWDADGGFTKTQYGGLFGLKTLWVQSDKNGDGIID